MKVVQAEFSVANTNYLNVLLRDEESSITTNYFKIFSLESEGMQCELSFNLSELIPSAHLYGDFNKDLDFKSFSQCAAEQS